MHYFQRDCGPSAEWNGLLVSNPEKQPDGLPSGIQQFFKSTHFGTFLKLR